MNGPMILAVISAGFGGGFLSGLWLLSTPVRAAYDQIHKRVDRLATENAALNDRIQNLEASRGVYR